MQVNIAKRIDTRRASVTAQLSSVSTAASSPIR